MKKLLGVLMALALLLLAAGAAADLAEIQAAGTLKVGLAPDYEPFEYYADGKLTGFDVDVINYVADQLGVKAEFLLMDFNSVMSSLYERGIDILPGLEANDERSNVFAPTKPYVRFTSTYQGNKRDVEFVMYTQKDNPDLVKRINSILTSAEGKAALAGFAAKYAGVLQLTIPGGPEVTPTEEPLTEATVKALKYKLSGSTATVTGPKSKNAKSLRIPASITVRGKTYKVTAIRANAFKGMKKLTTVSIDVYVKKIGKNAFLNCKKLKTITIKTSKLTEKTVGANAFKGISKKATVKVPGKKLKDYKTLLVKKGLPKTAKVKKKELMSISKNLIQLTCNTHLGLPREPVFS